MKTNTQDHQARWKAVRARLQKLIDIGMATKVEAGRFILGPNSKKNLASATIANWMGSRVPNERHVQKMEAFLRSKESKMRRLLSAAPGAGS